MRYDDFLLVYNAGPEATYKLLLSIMENSLKQSAQMSHQKKPMVMFLRGIFKHAIIQTAMIRGAKKAESW